MDKVKNIYYRLPYDWYWIPEDPNNIYSIALSTIKALPYITSIREVSFGKIREFGKTILADGELKFMRKKYPLGVYLEITSKNLDRIDGAKVLPVIYFRNVSGFLIEIFGTNLLRKKWYEIENVISEGRKGSQEPNLSAVCKMDLDEEAYRKRKELLEWMIKTPKEIRNEITKSALKSLEPGVLREERAERIVQKCKERKYRDKTIGFSVSESKKDEEIERINHPKNEKKEISKKKTVLVVDNELGPREGLRMILRPLYEVHTASDSEEALRLLANKDFDLVTTDLNRPGLSGIDFLKEVKRIRPNKKVIVITGMATLANAKAAIEYGASDFISKPYNTQDLLSAVEKALGIKKTEMRL